MIIYLIENVITHKIYIGQTTRKLKERIKGHKSDSKKYEIGKLKYISHLYASMAKYGWNNFEFSIIDDTAKTQEQLDKFEIWWIEFFDSTNEEIGYNIQNGGNGKGKMSEKTKLRISEANKNMFFSKEHRQKISEAQKGRFFSKEHKQKIGKAHKGKIISEEHKQKLSEFNKGKKHTDEAKIKMSKATRGIKKSDEHRKKMSEAKKTVDKETVDKIRLDYLNGLKQIQLVIKYGIKQGIIHNIVRHKCGYND